MNYVHLACVYTVNCMRLYSNFIQTFIKICESYVYEYFIKCVRIIDLHFLSSVISDLYKLQFGVVIFIAIFIIILKSCTKYII